MATELHEELKSLYEKGSYGERSDTDAEIYKEFQGRFGKEAIEGLGENDVLLRLFGWKKDDSLLYRLDKKTNYFGGHAIQFTWQRLIYEKDGAWFFSTARNKTEHLSLSEAEAKAEQYRDIFVDLFKLIESLLDKDGYLDPSGYEKIEKKAEELFTDVRLWNWVWFKKYLAMLYPKCFMNFFGDDFVTKLFAEAGLTKEPTWYECCRSFSGLSRELGIPNLDLYKVLETRYWDKKADDQSGGGGGSEENKCDEEKMGTNIILYGVPGCGKSYAAETRYIKEGEPKERVVFHPDYTYADFVGQILPRVENGNVAYEFAPGPFTRIMEKATKDPSTKHWLVIEEINRGNAPAIFGDIFQLLDRDENGKSRYGISNPDIAKIVYGKEEEVRIPSNLCIIATMNTSDQNVFPLDTAFQRRWEMCLIRNEFDKGDDLAKKEILDTGVRWEYFLETINRIFLETDAGMVSSEDKRLGVHFVSNKDLKDPGDGNQCPFAEKVLKYLWDDAFRFNRGVVFAEDLKCLDDVVKKFNNESGKDRLLVFSTDLRKKFGAPNPSNPSEAAGE